MITMHGKISDKLRGLYGNFVGNWPAARAVDEITDMPAGNYTGVHLAPAGRRGRHRK